MKEKILTLAIMTMLLTAIIPIARLDVINASQTRDSVQNSELTPQQKISPQLIEKLKNAGINGPDVNEQVKILIRHKPNVKIIMPEGVEVLNHFTLVPIISAISSLSKIEEISKLPGVEYVYADLKIHIASDESPKLPYPDYSKAKEWKNAGILDEEFQYTPWFGNYPTYLNETTALIGARDLWAQGITGKNVTIAIIDTGINKNHPDLDDMDDNPLTHDPKVLAEASFVPYETPEDQHGHGTHVASTAAGTGGTGAMGFYGTFPYSGIYNATILSGAEKGVAPGAYLYNAKAFDSGGSGDTSWIIAAIEWSVEHGADVISGSFGGWPDVPAEQDPVVLALKEAIEHGVVVVISAGNDGWGYFTTGSPGFAPDVITVGASTETDQLAFFSSRGPEQFELHAKPDILAPGTCIVAAFTAFREIELIYGWQIFYWEISGTSMATPHASGAAALLLEAFPGATPYSVKAAMMQGADDLGLDPMAQGAGRLNVKKAYDIMDAAPKTQWTSPIPTDTYEAVPPAFSDRLNLTGVSILVEQSFSLSTQFSDFISRLQYCGATISTGTAPYTNDTLVDPGTGQPYYDILIIPRPVIVNTLILPPSTLEHYTAHNGTVLFIGDSPYPPTEQRDYGNWTKIWGITWNNTAVGGLSSHISSHSITDGITELYFGSPIASLIVNTSMLATTVAWDPIFPEIAVWETAAPATGKVVVIADDGVLDNQYLHMADNLKLGLNIVKWFTGATEMEIIEVPFFTDDVEFGPDGWSSTGLWHITEHRSQSPTHSWYYGQEMVWNFETGGINSGSLYSPSVLLIDGTIAYLKYDYWYQTETQGTVYDQRWVLVSVDAGPYMPLKQLQRDPMQTWLTDTVDLTSFIGHSVSIQFYFDTVDDISNDYEGWYIDNIDIIVGKSPGTPPAYHEIGVGGILPKYVLANTTATIAVNVTNFGTYTEDVTLYLNGMNVQTVNNLAANTSVIVNLNKKLNATLICNFSGVNTTSWFVWGSIADTEIDYSNNGFLADISAVPKGKRTGDNPLLAVMTPMKIESLSAPLITMYPKDFTMHNITAFIGGGELVNAAFQITGNVSQIADFVNVTEFAYHYSAEYYPGYMLPDPSPAYFIPNMTSIIGDSLTVDNVSAPAMLFAELQVYIAENTPIGTYTGQVELLNGTTTIASTTLTFEVQTPKYKVLWEDYYNDYEYMWIDCERLWGGSVWGYGVSEWWKLAAQAGFDVDSLHQQVYLKQHLGMLGQNAVDPMGIIAYGGYDALYMHDVDYDFSSSEIAVFRQLYETGKMDFAVAFDGGSENLFDFTSYYGISFDGTWINDLLITGFDATHPIFNGVNNFTMYSGPVFTVEPSTDEKSVTTGIAAGTDDWSSYYGSGFVVAVNEMEATPHLTSRMIAVSDANTFEYLEYSNFIVWYQTLMLTGEGEVVSKVDTDKFAVNMLKWLDPQFANESPVVDYFDVTPTTSKLGETVSVDVVVHDPEGDGFNVTIAVQKPDSSWTNATVTSVGGHWLRSFTTDLEGAYKVYVVATDSYGATTTLLITTVSAVNMPPEIVSVGVSPSKAALGENVFITLNAKDMEDGVPANITIVVTAPNASTYQYSFTNVGFATVIFDTSSKSEGIYNVNAIVKDPNGAQTTATIGVFEVENNAPEIVSYQISPSKVVSGEVIFITVSGEDLEDITPTKIVVSIINPSGSTQNYTFLNTAVANVVFNTNGKVDGVYEIEVTITDSTSKATTANIGSFEIKPVSPFAMLGTGEAAVGVGIIGLIVLVLILLIIFKRFPSPQTPPATPPPAPA